MPDSTSEAISGSWGGSPRFSASLAIQAATCSLRCVVAGVGVGAAGVGDRGRDVGRAGRLDGRGRGGAATGRLDRGRRGGDAAGRGCERRGRGRRPGRCVALDADELDVGLARVPGHGHDPVLVVALERGELPVLDVAGDEADVAVGAEVLLAAPVVTDDVAGAGVLGADDLEVVVAGFGVLHPGLDRGPAAALHLVAVLRQRPGHEARAPRVAGTDPRCLEVLVDLGAGVDALLLDALGQLALRDLQSGRRRGRWNPPRSPWRRRPRRPAQRPPRPRSAGRPGAA